MKFNNPYWSTTEKIELLQRWILFHAYCYYELDTNFVPDTVYDKNAHQLARLMDKYPEEVKNSRYKDFFVNYDGNTAYDVIQALKGDLELLRTIQRDVYILKTTKKV